MDREKVIDGIEETISYLRCHEGTLIERLIQHQNDALALLKEQEAVEPETGHWIEYEGMQGKYYDCSACDYSLMEIHRGMKYCPYCGAKMDNPM